MTDSKVYIALDHLSIYELNSFKKFLESPYFNSNEILVSLYELYEPLLKEKIKEDLDKETIWAALYPKEEYNDTRYRKVHSELLKLFETFVAQKEYDTNKSLRANLTLQAVRKRKIEKLYKSVTSSTDRTINQNYNRSTEYLYSKYYNEKEKLELYSESELLRKRSKSIENDVNITEIVKYLDQFYLSEKLKYYVKLLGWKKMISLKQELENIEEMHGMIVSPQNENIPPIMIYNTITKTQIDQDNVDNYFQLKRLVDEYIDNFPDDEIRNIYDALLSFCVRRVNKGDLAFQEETLNVYKEALRKETIFQDGNITQVTFNNIVFFALRTGAYDWAEEFIENYNGRLKDEDRPSSVAFSKARVMFYREEFGKAIELLQQVEMNSVVYTLSSKTILLLSYYELDEFDALDSFVNSFRVYINREKGISSRKKGHYKNLLKYTKRLLNLRSNDKKGLIALKDELAETSGVASKPWLLQKVEDKISGNYR